MRVLISGADGFLGQNLKAHLAERQDVEIVCFTRENQASDLPEMLKRVDFVFHLAGVNRTQSETEFKKGNVELTHLLSESLSCLGKKIPVVFSSSTQAALPNPYGESKRAAEVLLEDLAHKCCIPVYIYRLPNVFGKWAKPNYNSAVATFCHNVTRGLPIQINDPTVEISLVYVDDVITNFIRVMDNQQIHDSGFCTIEPLYKKTVGELAEQIYAFSESRDTLITEPVGSGFVRALYSTYVSYLPPEKFSYEVKQHVDPRGVFVEMLKTKDSGQFSIFTAHAGVTRGGHYHHSKTEKFLVIKGNACFRFRHIISGEYYDIFTCGDKPKIVETVPGWSHDITNVGHTEMTVALWANEIFDRACPDTFAREL